MNLGRNLRILAFVILIPTFVQAGTDNAVDSQIIPEFGRADTKAANRTVEDIFIQAYTKTFDMLKRERGLPEAIALVNAPISGKTEKRGRHLLSFAAFSGFKRLATWAWNRGARIDAGDKDNATMLRMAVANRLYYMVKFALDNGANPNLIAGETDTNMIGDMMYFSWPLRGFELAWNYKARFKDDQQRKELIEYLTKRETSPQDYARLQTMINKFNASDAINGKETITAKPARSVDIDMIDVMDRALLDAIYGGQLPRAYLATFSCHGMPLAHYLTFNGMTYTLKLLLSRAGAGGLVLQRDRTGNDLLSAAIKSLNVEIVKLVLETSIAGINRAIPDRDDYYSAGDYPLHLAIKWEVSDEIFALLFKYGARKSLALKNSSGLTPFELLESWHSLGYIPRDSYERMRSALLQ